MIKQESTSKEWIDQISKSQKADKILVEKVVRALILLEGLVESGLDFTFRGGTALMLMLSSTRRLSIDIDITIENKELDLVDVINSIVATKGFTRFEKNERNAKMKIDKEHYKLFFHSVVENKESYVLLDVLKEKKHHKTILEIPINSVFIEHSGNMVNVKTPDFNSLLGDKLTAFAPNTTGIPYYKGEKEMGMEVIKQLYDISNLFNFADNLAVVSSVFQSFAKTEIAYRNGQYGHSEVLDDIIDNCLEICLRGNHGKANYDVLFSGINRIKGFIFSESFHLEKAITCAAKATYIASLIKFDKTEIKRYDVKYLSEIKDWQITNLNTKLNKLKKTDPEAFFYLYQVSEMKIQT
jgi:predicted nucleotidyltransferase component of viral defense system